MVSVALGASNLWPLNIPIGRSLRWVALAELAAAALLYAAVRGRARLPGLVTALAGAFLALALTSTLWSPDPRLTLGRGASLAVLFAAAGALAYGAAGQVRATGQILLAQLAAAAAVAVGGLVELAFRSDLAAVPATTGTPVRYNGLGSNPQTMAMVFAACLPLGVWAIVEARSWIGRVIGSAVVLLLYGSIVASGSRGPLLGAMLGMSVTAAVLLPGLRGRAIAVAGAAAALGLGFLLMEVPQPASRNPVISTKIIPPAPIRFSRLDAEGIFPLRDEIGFPRPGERQRPRSLWDSSGRLDAWPGAIGQAAERPVVGYGFGTEERVFVDRYYSHYSTRVENSFIGTLLQLGLVGAALLIALVGAVLVQAWRSARRLPPSRRRVAAACAGVVVGALVLATTQSFLTSVGSPASAPFWICAFLLGAVGARSGAAEEPPSFADRQRDEREPDAAQRHREARLDVMGA